ncbi:AzlD domain-containing protein [Effusibacillus consociatus]|uniref:AzlD domain-containing protein n=1 Tax=Effusibacillus consociatus TaxID=1117041 RepID=A0ABV9PXE7_9BACL
MSTGSTFLLILGMAAVTYLTRRAFLRLPDSFFSPRLKNGLTFIPVGIFAGLIFPSLFVKQGEFVIQPLYLLASAVCLGVMIVSRNVFLSLGISLLVVVLGKTGVVPLY